MVAMGIMIDKPWVLNDFLFTFVMWAVMMVGMMSPAALPVLLILAAAQSKRSRSLVLWTTTMFALGYIAMAFAPWGLHQATMVPTAMALSNPVLAPRP
jgi:predicted metal-binding membrane protein